MGRLLPTETDASVERSDEPSVLCIDDEATCEVFSALGSETAQDIFRLLNEEPATPATIAEGLDMSVQNVHYHLGNLDDVGLIEVVDTCYSEKGREMDVFVVAEDPTLVFLGTSDDKPAMRRAFESFASVVGVSPLLVSLGNAVSGLLGEE
ncbi:helix-turn-helix domain-containing protein [Haloarcula sp. S1CR25-12]|uniref:Helix-turn-helix domain-containing protein n=1 Tax=Haloarcula saliterrae TaxID=2950534 RepID=A0ABU2F7Y0_9EURY|nr:helix-turn-helix domain-containing protein [Haloarcula sp. S1CR25-12]MDS0257941.1 helix-turn-helix domain-containing protein [Haloarcula sp. S1CR25-12]